VGRVRRTDDRPGSAAGKGVYRPTHRRMRDATDAEIFAYLFKGWCKPHVQIVSGGATAASAKAIS
jgi:hypothetical protein